MKMHGIYILAVKRGHEASSADWLFVAELDELATVREVSAICRAAVNTSAEISSAAKSRDSYRLHIFVDGTTAGTGGLCETDNFVEVTRRKRVASEVDTVKSRLKAAMTHLRDAVKDESPDVVIAAVKELGREKSTGDAQITWSLYPADDTLRTQIYIDSPPAEVAE